MVKLVDLESVVEAREKQLFQKLMLLDKKSNGLTRRIQQAVGILEELEQTHIKLKRKVEDCKA